MYLGFKTFSSSLGRLSKDDRILERKGSLENTEIQGKDLLDTVHI